MYQVRHTKAADAAAEVLMKMGHGWWWIHADEDEGFRMARVNSPEGDRLAKSGSPSLAGPFSRDTDLLTLTCELHKAQCVEMRPEHKRASRLDLVRESILDMMEDQSLTTPQIAGLCCATPAEVRNALRDLQQVGRMVRTGQLARRRGGSIPYWRKVA